MSAGGIPNDVLERLHAVRGKRSRVVVQHILAHGHITSEELQRDYGYEHPPRAVRDVREQGIPIETFSVGNADGKTIAAYRLGDLSQLRTARISGRVGLPKALKRLLLHTSGPRCGICRCEHEERFLQVDHRVPYEVAGDIDVKSQDAYMLVCQPCNRAKSWSCEHCPNWSSDRNPNVCQTCYWAMPTGYAHAATVDIRRLDLAWTGDQVADFDLLARKATETGLSVPEHVKQLIRRHLRRKP